MTKRALELNLDECNIVFDKFDLATKRAALASIREEFAVYTEIAPFRDVLSIIIRYVDLATWGRMRRACKMMSLHLPQYPILKQITDIFTTKTITAKELGAWRHIYYSSRFDRTRIFHNQLHLFFVKLDAFVRNKFKRSPGFTLNTMISFHCKKKYCNVLFDFAKLFIHFPSGFITRRTAKTLPLGNIFLDDWQELIVYENNYFRMKKITELKGERLQYYQVQKAQLNKIYGR